MSRVSACFGMALAGFAVFAPAPVRADSGPVIVIPSRPGIPVVINGRDASYAVVEGDWGPHQGPTIVEFPTFEQLRAWYHSPEYAPLKALRQEERSRPSRCSSETWRRQRSYANDGPPEVCAR